MAKKKFDLENPAMNFISAADRQPEPQSPENYTPPEGFKLVPAENRTHRVSAVFRPSIANALWEKANTLGISNNEFINRAVEHYLEYLEKGDK